jgi:Resolvase, N terminal domain
MFGIPLIWLKSSSSSRDAGHHECQAAFGSRRRDICGAGAGDRANRDGRGFVAVIRLARAYLQTLIRSRYDDGGYSGGSTDRPVLQRLLSDLKAGKIDVIVVYKVDRLTRSLADFAKLVELFDGHGVSFVSVTQQLNTTTSMGRLTLNVWLSFAQFMTMSPSTSTGTLPAGLRRKKSGCFMLTG